MKQGPVQKVEVKINRAFEWLWTDQQHRYKVLKGGAGSGKSYSVCQYLLSQFLTVPGCNMIFSRKVANTMRGSLFALVKQIVDGFGCRHLLDINEDLRIQHRYNKNMIFFIGVDDPEKMKSITAENGNIEKIWMEEASEFDKEDFFQFDTRLRGESAVHKEIIMSFNPISEEHWLKGRFWDMADDRAGVHHSTYRDNAYLSAEDKETLERFKDIDPYHYSVYCLGEWGSVGANDTIIPYKLVYEARNRINPAVPVGVLEVGVDCARFGDDDSVAYIKRDFKVLGKTKANGNDGPANARMILLLIAQHRKDTEPVRVKVDVGGLGASTVDALRLLAPSRVSGIEVVEINYGGAAKQKDRYYNTVTEMYFDFAKMLPQLSLLSDDADVVPELSKRKYTVQVQSGQFRIEDKKDFKKRIAHSPDSADALVTAFYQPPATNEWLKNL